MSRSIRDWAHCYTQEGRFSPIGVAFHWTMAFLILFQLALGWWVSFMPAGGGKWLSYGLHAAVGIAILVLAVLRIVWRIMITDPYNAADTQGWLSKVAYAVEHAFYLAFILLPLSGWAMWSTIAPRDELSLADLLPWPLLPLGRLPESLQWQIMDVSEDVHLIMVWVLMILVPLHVAAALKHHFWDRTDVLRGILPQIPDAPDPREPNTAPEPQSPAPSARG
jgi:cytochrome b561